MHLRCELFGCREDGPDGFSQPRCYRCRAHVYDGDFVQIGRLDWLPRLGTWARRRAAGWVVGHKCVVCGKKYRGQYRIHGVCSEKCMPEMPF